MITLHCRVDAVKYTKALKMTMNAVYVSRKFRYIAQNNRTRSGQADRNFLNNFPRAWPPFTRMRSERPTASSTLWVMNNTIGDAV